MRVLHDYLRRSERAWLRDFFDERRDNFELGAQLTGYRRLRVKEDRRFAFLLDFMFATISLHKKTEVLWDAFLLHYPRGASIPYHRDDASVFGLWHVRVNALITAPIAGGRLTVEGLPVTLYEGSAYVFEPDRETHGVDEIVFGERLVISVGAWLPGFSA